MPCAYTNICKIFFFSIRFKLKIHKAPNIINASKKQKKKYSHPVNNDISYAFQIISFKIHILQS